MGSGARSSILLLLALALALPVVAAAASARAQEGPRRRIELRFTPTARVQMAAWIESADGERFATLALTEAVSYRGIGNRPGATQMNSGFRYPYGRREGALPIWAHRRISYGDSLFSRVIFDGRRSEGHASSALSPGERVNTRDDFYCLAFTGDSSQGGLDAVSCASVFASNKGRYLTDSDLAAGYAEPFEAEAGRGMMRPLSRFSLYPPRRDVIGCSACGPDVGRFIADARAAMPEIDAVTMATPPGGVPHRLVFLLPEDWPEGDYVAYLEVNTEGDHNERYSRERYPTPRTPDGSWDVWSSGFGYPYRGQPSVLYRVPISVAAAGDVGVAVEPIGYGALHGEDGEIRPLDGTITDDPVGAPGSGADRLLTDEEGGRFEVSVPRWDICEQPEPPPECGETCVPGERCGPELICAPDATCVGLCDLVMAPDAVSDLGLTPHEDPSQSHHFAHLRFRAPRSARAIARYEVRVSGTPIASEEDYLRALPANAATLESEALVVPTDAAQGEAVEVEIGGLSPESRYFVAVRAYDECASSGPFAVAEVRTTEIHFTTVSPCFVATAAYGDPLSERIGVLRRFRDRHLMSHAPGRALVRAYYALSPPLAERIREEEGARAAARALLDPLVELLE